ncbi:MAG: GNAT family N-acetyltransferase [Caldilineaceae bacterium]|nr:GNAT family N-acetyltransferase [Caldilineaceae bacterium]HRJ44386.1 GNAT family N-acetyltransferase [Caldilineaceae bacterium]
MSNATTIHSERLDLIPMTPDFLQACLHRDADAAAALLGLPVADEWFEQEWLIALRLELLLDDPTYQPWSVRAVVLRASGEMIGHIGFHTGPDPDYLAELAPKGVEFGYTIFAPFRRRGYAEEASRALMGWATGHPDVERFVLFISPENTPSLKLAEKLGFGRIGDWMDEEDGLEWVFAREVFFQLITKK